MHFISKSFNWLCSYLSECINCVNFVIHFVRWTNTRGQSDFIPLPHLVIMMKQVIEFKSTKRFKLFIETDVLLAQHFKLVLLIITSMFSIPKWSLDSLAEPENGITVVLVIELVSYCLPVILCVIIMCNDYYVPV